jgi:hypothetical protein
LLQQLDSFTGYLFGVNDKSDSLLAALPEEEVPEELKRWFVAYLAQELAPELATDSLPRAASGGGKSRSNRRAVPFRYVDPRGQPYEPLFLAKPEGPHHRLAAILVFHASSDTRRRPSRELQQEIAEQLLEHGDVTGALLEASGTQTRTR